MQDTAPSANWDLEKQPEGFQEIFQTVRFFFICG